MMKLYTGRVRVENLVVDGDVPAGGTYQTTCRPLERLRLYEIVIYDFTLVELYIGNFFTETKERAGFGYRVYHLQPAGNVPPAQEVVILLKNATERPLCARMANFELARQKNP